MPKTVFFFQILTNGKFSFYFFADRFEVKKTRFIRAVSEFFFIMSYKIIESVFGLDFTR